MKDDWKGIRAFSSSMKGDLFWSGELGLTLVTIALSILIFVITPFQEKGIPGRFVFDIFVVALMLSAAFALKGNRVFKFFLISVIAATAVAIVLARFHPARDLVVVGSVFALLSLIFYVRVVLMVMFRAGPVTWSRIQGGVCAYLLMGMAWASTFEIVELLRPGSFQFVTLPTDIDQLTAKLTYYSFSTLTTLGCDISPIDPFARYLSIAEAVVGQLFPAIFIGALVAMAMQAKNRP